MAMKNEVATKWSKISLISAIVFAVGWMQFGLFGAMAVSVGVLALMGLLSM
jgi:hypothetical protein